MALVEVEGLDVSFKLRTSLFERSQRLRAVRNVSFTVDDGETLGLVGESGSGKSTTGRAMLKLIDNDAGSIRFHGHELAGLSRSQMRSHRPKMQMVFQDPYSSLNPSMLVGDSIAEPLRVHTSQSKLQIRGHVAELLERVGLRAHHARRYPYEFSGGQRQRIAIARAIALNPDIVVLDEAVSALDVSTQNQVVNLLEDLRDSFGLAYLFIAHDLSVVRHISHRVAVMYLGEIVEIGPAERVYQSPGHPYTQALLSAVPVPNPQRQRERRRIILPGDLPDPTNPPSGCSFHTRCPHAIDICRTELPPEVAIDGGGTARCHLHVAGPVLGGASVTALPLPDSAASTAAS